MQTMSQRMQVNLRRWGTKKLYWV